MSRNLSLLIAILVVVFTACNKPTGQAVTKVTTSDTMFRLINNNTRALHIGMYTSAADLLNRQNVRYSCNIPGKSTYKIPFSALDTQAIYYYDVYSTDFVISNWANSNSGFKLFYTGHSFTPLNLYSVNKCSYFFLNGNDTMTSWKAVDKLNNSNVSEWAALDDNAKYMRLVVRRNETGVITTKQSNGAPVTNNIVNMSSYYDTLKPHLSLNTTSSSSEYSLYAGPIIPEINYDNKTSRDTILLEDYFEYWVIVKN